MLVKGSAKLPTVKNAILLIQLGDIGDVVLTMPTIQALRESFPTRKLLVCVREKAREIIADCPWTDGVIALNSQQMNLGEYFHYQWHFFQTLRSYHFDWAIELRTGTRGAILTFFSGAPTRTGRYARDGQLWRNRVFTHLVNPVNEEGQYVAEHCLNIISPFGLAVKSPIPSLTVPSHRKKKALEIFKQEQIPVDRPIIAFHPFSLWKYKELDIEQCIQLVDHITIKYGAPVILTGAPEERTRAEKVMQECGRPVFNLAGRTSVGELSAILQTCSLFIGVDTAALHIAAAVGTPTIGIFGPSSPRSWAPRGEKHTVVFKNMHCVPCRQKGCQNTEISRCLKELNIEEIMEKVDSHIAQVGVAFA
ncbi:glycosyltransferase family 9 protein [Thermodesulfobacteriota bacterium]